MAGMLTCPGGGGERLAGKAERPIGDWEGEGGWGEHVLDISA